MTTSPQAKGFTTSEFWLSVASVVATLLVAHGVLTTAQVDPFIQLVSTVMTGVAAIVVIGQVAIRYTSGRVTLKEALLEVAPTVDVTNATTEVTPVTP